jgi:hypothetical protein
VALLANVLLTDTSPEDVVVCEVLPTLCDLGGATERSRVEVAENLETDFSGEDSERVYANEMGKLLGEKRKLGEATHGEETLENESTTGMRRRGKVGPDGVDGLPFFKRQGIERLHN